MRYFFAAATFFFALLFGCSAKLAAAALIYELDGENWRFSSANGTIRGAATVPGDIFTHLHRAGVIGDPRLGDADVRLRWVSRGRWIYERRLDDLHDHIFKVTRAVEWQLYAPISTLAVKVYLLTMLSSASIQ